jgi:putative ABC transport system permease protein
MLKNYLKIALKGLLRRKYYTFISLFGIIITLAVLTVSVAMMNLATSMGESGSKLDRCLIVNRIEIRFNRGDLNGYPSYYVLDQYVRNLKGPEAISIFSEAHDAVIYSENSRIPLKIKYTDDIFWDIVELPFLEGMSYKKEAIDRADMVAVITDRAKQNIFGVKPALGEYLETSKGKFRIIGIIPYREIKAIFLNADIFAPITTSLGAMNNKELWGDELALVQAADKSQFASIKSEFQSHMDQLIKDHKDALQITSLNCFIGTMNESFVSETGQSGIVAFLGVIGMMILFMLLPAVNLTTINISRIMERFPEIGIRKAFGASSITLMGQFIIENIILTLIGGLIAYLLSWIALLLINNSGVVPWGYIELDLKVFFYSMIVTMFFGIFSGVLPSYRMSRLHPAEALKGISR